METIEKAKCVEVGFVQKTHGIDGELTLQISGGLMDTFDEVDIIFFEIDGLLVPFFPDVIRIRSQKMATIQFDDLASLEKAVEFVGCKVFVERDDVVADDTRFQPELIIGFSVDDINKGHLGKIANVSDYSGNVLLDIEKENGDLIMLPLSEDFIRGFDEAEALITVECPDGLLDLFE
ncbi:hypothetical protein EMN47_04970 [Prolixibacteraceae bacterium JC049]|nr:hypothetical protein [Prolixibacteraceae bacterium JC049]